MPIGAALSDGVELVYESGGNVQPPWLYDSVRVVAREGFDRCVLVARASRAARESCVRGDTLFDRNDAGAHVASRPIGPHMRLQVRGASGNVLEYTTGAVSVERVAGGVDVPCLSTTIVTRNESGAVTRRLRECYAPALLTAVLGVFEAPDASGGWSATQEFRLREVRPAAAGVGRSG